MIIFNDQYIVNIVPKMNFEYYPSAGLIYYFFPVQYSYLVVRTISILIKEFGQAKGIKKEQLRYVLIGSAIGFSGGSTTFPLMFGIELYPFGVIQVPIYLSIITYAVVKYRLMDIRVAVSRFGVFFFVYSLVLGVPFWVGVKFLGIGLWLMPVLFMAVLATAGPFIFLYLQKRAEAVLLEQENRIRRILSNASFEINRFRDLQKLLDLITDLLTKTVRLEGSAIYLWDDSKNAYTRRSPRIDKDGAAVKTIKVDDPFIEQLKAEKHVVIYDELNMKLETEGSAALKQVTVKMEQLSSHAAIPILMDNKLLGFLSLGERRLQTTYSEQMKGELWKFANQIALAVENCRHHERENLHARFSFLEWMAASWAHTFKNPLSMAVYSNVYISDVLEMSNGQIPEDKLPNVNKHIGRVKEGLDRIQVLVDRILTLSKKKEVSMVPISMNEVVNTFVMMIESVFKNNDIDFKQDVQEGLPPVLGDPFQLEEVLINFAENSVEYALSEVEDKKIVLKVFQKDPDTIRVEFSDNGYGIEKDMLQRIFLPTETVRRGSVEGTGFGLYRVKKVAEIHHGRVWAESEGEGQGAKFIVELPVYKMEE